MLAQVDYTSLGQRIRKYRCHYKLTQALLAEAVGVSTQFIGNLERGCAVPSLDTLLSLSYALDVSPNDLLQDSFPLCGFSGAFPLRLRQPESIFQNTLDRVLLSQSESIYDDQNLLVGYLFSEAEDDSTSSDVDEDKASNQ
ncbi:MAG: helix-turn-helix transcriptional regulator [Clostridia bacterium]|nr:helix-turn-helix transcriptional regulator [Clostridia bacterium]